MLQFKLWSLRKTPRQRHNNFATSSKKTSGTLEMSRRLHIDIFNRRSLL